MLKLVDILNIRNEDYKNYKIHFATGASDKLERSFNDKKVRNE